MMKNSLLTASVLGAVSAIVSGVAFADDAAYTADNSSTYCKPGFYAGVQGGRSDTFYHKGDVFNEIAGNGLGGPLGGFAPASFPTSISVEGGEEIYNISSAPIITSNTSNNGGLVNQHIDDIGLGGRIYAGYQFNPYFAIETGYTQYAKTSFSANQANSATQVTSADYTTESEGGETGTNVVTQTFNGNTSYSGDVTEHAVDLVAKLTLPLAAGFGAYVDGGAAFVAANRYINSLNNGGTVTTSSEFFNDDENVTTGPTTTNVAGSGSNTVFDKTYQAVRPVAGAGLDYTIPNTNVDISVFYNRLFGNNNNGVGIPDASLWGLGAGYKFA